jgi:DNA repair protein SbcD/Mre11
MKILHTGDWHLNHRLGRVDLTPMLQDAVRQIAGYLSAHEIDVLVIAGDLFSGRESREQLSRSLRFLRDTMGPFLSDGGTIVAVSGTHDSEAFFETLRDAFELVSPIREDSRGIHAPGRLYLAPNPRVLTLEARDGQAVQFVLMPYPTPRCYLSDQDAHYKSVDERNAAMAQVFRERMSWILNEKVEKDLPALLVSHAQVRGVPVNDLFHRSDEPDVILEIADLPFHFAYGAYGHIHRQSPVTPGRSHFWYSGSLLPLGAGEQGQPKGVLVVEISQDGLTGPPQVLPIAGPRLLELTIAPPEIGTLREQYPDCDTALVKYCLRYDPDAHPDPFPLHDQVRAIFPYWYDSAVEPVRPRESDTRSEESQPFSHQWEDMASTVLGYLETTATWDGGDAAREHVIALAGSLLADDELMACVKEVR